MEYRKFYKENPVARNHVQNMKDSVLADRRSKRLQKFNETRKNLEAAEIEEGNGPKEEIKNRQALLLQWKQKKLKEKKVIDEKKKKPFVVGIIHHNIGSPLFKDISNIGKPPQNDKRHFGSSKVITSLNKPENVETTKVKRFPFVNTASKPQFKFKLQPSLKKLTIPQSPNFLSAKKKKMNQDKSKNLKLESGKDPIDQKENVGNSDRNLRNRKCRVRLETEAPKKKELPKKVKLESIKTTPPASEPVLDSCAYVFNTNPSSSEDELHQEEFIVSDVLEDNKEMCARIKIASQDGSPEATAKSDEPEKEEFVISPFVTINRGKQRRSAPRPIDSAKKQDRRTSKNLSSLLKEQDDDVASEATTYYEKLNKETDHIIGLCDNWSKMVLTLKGIPKEMEDEIDAVVGQSRLLVKDKFEQFRSLVYRFESKVEPPVIKSDLDGFWDMMYIQVELVNERFSKLNSLKENNWMPVSDISSVKHPKLKRQVKKGSEDKSTKQVKARGNFRQFLEELKKKNTATQNLNDGPLSNEKEVLSNDLPFNTSASPRLSRGNVTPRKSAPSESLLKKVLSNSVCEKIRTSTGAAHVAVRTSLIGKELGTSPVKLVDSFNVHDSPSNRSILRKSPRFNDSKRKKKVLFGDATCFPPCEDDTDDVLNTTFTLQDNSEDECEKNQLNSGCGFLLNNTLERKEEVDFDISTVTPKQSRKRRLDSNFTPRRSARLILKAEMSTPSSSNLQPELSLSTGRRYISGTPHPKK